MRRREKKIRSAGKPLAKRLRAFIFLIILNLIKIFSMSIIKLSMKNISDEQLIADYLKGEENSLEILIRRHLKTIYNFAYRYVGNVQEAEDITQETFVKAWRNLKRPALSLSKGFRL